MSLCIRVCARALMIVCAFGSVCGSVRTICLTLLEINKAIMCVRLRRSIFLCSILTCVDVADEDEYLRSIKQTACALNEAFAIWLNVI